MKNERIELPDTLHRYLNFKRGREIMDKGELWLSEVSMYNDPFEALPGTEYTQNLSLTPEQALEQLRVITESEDGKSFLASIGAVGIAGAAALGLYIPATIAAGVAGLWTLFSALDKNEKENFKLHMEKFAPMLASAKVCSFSSSPSNLLMWSHYADWHKGMVLTFSTNRKYWRSENFYKVDYCTKRMELPTENTNFNRYLTDILTSKSEDWKYEEEWRMVNWTLQDKNQLAFSSDALKEIRIGLLMPQAERDKILRLRNEKYPHAKVLVAERDNYEYKFNFVGL